MHKIYACISCYYKSSVHLCQWTLSLIGVSCPLIGIMVKIILPLLITLAAQLQPILSQRGGGVSLGKFLYNGHGLQGEVIVLNERQYRIKGFSYDGGGPAVWHTGMKRGSVGVYSQDAYAFRNEQNNCNRLSRRYTNKDVVITLPRHLSIPRDIESIAVYCYRFCHNFGHVKVPRNLKVPAAPRSLRGNSDLCKPNHAPCSRDRTRDNGVCTDKSGNDRTCPVDGQPSSPSTQVSRRGPLQPPRGATARSIGRFLSYANGVTGEVIVLNDKQFRIKGFTYTGARGGSTYFLVMEKGTRGIFSVKAFAVPDERGKCEGLRSYKGDDLVITMPQEISITRDVSALAVYDYENCSNFGHVVVPNGLGVPSGNSRNVPKGRKVCLPYFRPCSRADTRNAGVCKSKNNKEVTCQ